MKTIELLERPTKPFEVAIVPDESGYTLNTAGVYQDLVTRDWAMQTCHRASRLAGEDRVQRKWHNTNSLSDPGILVDAVRAALVADVNQPVPPRNRCRKPTASVRMLTTVGD